MTFTFGVNFTAFALIVPTLTRAVYLSFFFVFYPDFFFRLLVFEIARERALLTIILNLINVRPSN